MNVTLPPDFYSHKASWIAALERLIELEPESHEPDRDDKAFWKHELKAMKRAYEELEQPRPVFAVMARTYDGGDIIGVCSSESEAQNIIAMNKIHRVVGDGSNPNDWAYLVELEVDKISPDYIEYFPQEN